MPRDPFVGRAPKSVYRVAICPAGCENIPAVGYVIVADNQFSYSCPCGQEVTTILLSTREHQRTLKEYSEQQFLEEADLMQACYAPQLNFTPEDE